MSILSRSILCALSIFCVVSAVGADNAINLQKARELTLSRSSTLRKASLAVSVASLAGQAQGYAALPAITASATGSLGYGGDVPSFQDGLGAKATLSASETVFNGGKTGDLVKKYGYATEAAQETLRATRLSLIGQADSAYFAVLEAAASVDAAASDLEAAKLRLNLAKTKAEVGALSKFDYLQSESDKAGYETALITAKKTLSSAQVKLASLTGLPASTSLKPVDFSQYDSLRDKFSRLDEAAIESIATKYKNLAKANNPTLSTYSLASKQAKLAVNIATKSYLPTLVAGYSHSVSRSGSSSETTSSGSLSLTASVSLDLWNTKNAVDQAALLEAQANLDGDQSQTDLDLSVDQTVYEWLASALSLQSSSKALEYAQSNYENVLEKFKLSSATASDLSTAEALVSTDKKALIAAQYSFLLNLSTLRGYAGIEDEAKLLEYVP